MATDRRFLNRGGTDLTGAPLPGRALQWEDMNRNQQTATNAEVRRVGTELPERWESMEWGSPPKHFDPDERLTGRPTSLRTATGERVRWVQQAEAEARFRNDLEALAGTGRSHTPRGLNWYGEHRQRYVQLARETGLPEHLVVQAGTGMSPNNSPETEQRAARGAARLVAHPDMEVTVSPEHAQRIYEVQTKGGGEGDRPHQYRVIDVPEGTHRVGDLTSEQLAVIGSTANMAGDTTGRNGRNDVKTGKRFDVPDEFRDLASIRNRDNAIKGLRILREEGTAEELAHPLSAPKVTSYGRATQLATFHEMERSHDDWLRRKGPQGVLDLEWSTDDDTATAEDSWMHGMSHGAGSPEVAKPIGTYRKLGSQDAVTKQPFGRNDPRQLGPELTGAAASHAWNNLATRRAAERLGYTPQSTQAISWTAQRIAAGQDPDYNREKAAWDAAVAAQQAQQRPSPHQETLF